MSTQTPAVPATAPLAAPPPGRAGFGHLLLSEWTKVRSVRSTVWSLGLFIVITVGLTVLFTWLTEANWSNGQNAGARAASVTADPVSFIMGAGAGLGQLVICVLGALLITTEYSTGVIRASLLAVPRRVPMLAAKAVVFTILILIVAEIVCVSSFLAGSSILSSKISVTMGDHGVARAVIGSGLYLTAIGLLAMAVGLLIRHTAGSIATIIGIVLVLPILSGLLPGSWGAHINAYLPEQAGTLIGQASRASGDLLGPWQGFGVLCLWVAVLMTIGIVLLKRRDA